MAWQRSVDYLVYVVVRILICMVQAMRIETGQRLARGLAWLFCDVLHIRGGVVDDNLAHAFPEMSAAERAKLTRRMWEHLFLLVLEVAHTPRKIHETNWRDYVRLKNEAELVRALLDDRPVLIVTAHLGNFEVGGYVLGILGFPTYTVARTLDNPYLDRFVNRFRGGTGQHIIPKNGGYDQIVEVLAQRRHDDLSGRSVCGAEGLLGRVLRPAGLGPQGDRPAGVGQQRADVGLCRPGGSIGRCSSSCTNYVTIDPQEVGNSVGTIRELTQWYTHAAGRTDPPHARSILVAASPLERHAREESGKRKPRDSIGRYHYSAKSAVVKGDWLRRLDECWYANAASGDGACPLLRRTTDVPRKKGDRHRGDDVFPDAASVCATEPVPIFPLT